MIPPLTALCFMFITLSVDNRIKMLQTTEKMAMFINLFLPFMFALIVGCYKSINKKITVAEILEDIQDSS